MDSLLSPHWGPGNLIQITLPALLCLIMTGLSCSIWNQEGFVLKEMTWDILLSIIERLLQQLQVRGQEAGMGRTATADWLTGRPSLRVRCALSPDGFQGCRLVVH